MADVQMSRRVKDGTTPSRFIYRIEYTPEEITKGYKGQADPNEQLHYNMFGEEFEAAPPSVQLEVIRRFAQIVEAPPSAESATASASVVPAR